MANAVGPLRFRSLASTPTRPGLRAAVQLAVQVAVQHPCSLRSSFAGFCRYLRAAATLWKSTQTGMIKKVRACFSKAYAVSDLEARVGIEPTNKGFADPGLTTWLPRHYR